MFWRLKEAADRKEFSLLLQSANNPGLSDEQFVCFSMTYHEDP